MRGTTKGWSTSSGVTGSQAGAMVAGPNLFSWYDDLVNLIESVFSVTGGGGAIANTSFQGRPGWVGQNVAAAGVDGHRIHWNTVLSICAGGGPIHTEISGFITTLSDGVNNGIVRIGALDPATGLADATDGWYFENDFGLNGDNRWRLCTSNNTARTKVDTGIIALASAVQKFEIDINDAGTLVSGKINGVPCASTIATNIPVTAARATELCLQTSKSLGAGAWTTQWDYYGISQQFTVAR